MYTGTTWSWCSAARARASFKNRFRVTGEPAVRLAAGESIWIEPGRRHWHGAGPDSPMTHVAYQQAADDLRTVEWHEPVAASAYETAIEETR